MCIEFIKSFLWCSTKRHTILYIHEISDRCKGLYFVCCVAECDRESPLYLEWDGFVAVMESWTNVMKSDDDLRTELVRSFRHVKVVRWRHVVYVACASGDGT